MQILYTDSRKDNTNTVFLVGDSGDIPDSVLDRQEQKYVSEKYNPGKKDYFVFNRYTHFLIVLVFPGTQENGQLERIRKKGDEIAAFLRSEKQDKCLVSGNDAPADVILAFAEGFALGCYDFVKHKSPSESAVSFTELFLGSSSLKPEDAGKLNNLVQNCYQVRDLVNEPVNMLDATQFAEKMAEWGKKSGLQVTILGKEAIRKAGMEALLTVNKGSISDPAFTIMEWKPNDALNTKPVVLVGKGLVFDTGGINLKPGAGLEAMKTDMAGGAAIFGAISALAMNKVPVHVVGLVPATDNRPGENAMVPGDIIRMSNGKTIEIINTDAEGRLILADALLYAQRYNPGLVINVATLTGAAAVAIGRHGIAGMHQGAATDMEMIKDSSMQVYERIAELPFWEEYGEDIRSDVADIRNLSKSRGGGTITAGKFLAHFTNYPFIHLDIATMAYMDARESYLGKGATGVGVRLLYHFLSRRYQKD